MTKVSLENMLVHDLKNPLSGITAAVGLLLDGYFPPINEEQKKIITDIKTSSDRLLEMLTDINDAADLENHTFELQLSSFPISDLLSGLKCSMPDQSVNIQADKPLLQRVIYHLSENAKKQCKQGEQPHCSVKAEANMVNISITFSSPKISPTLLSKIFDRNFKVENYEQRALVPRGYSFYFCRLTVEAHQGKLWADLIDPETVGYYLNLPLKR